MRNIYLCLVFESHLITNFLKSQDMKNLNQIAAKVTATAKRRGQLNVANPILKMVNKCIEEAEEAVEAIENNDFRSEMLDTNSPTFYSDFETKIKSSLGDELADVIFCALIAAHEAKIDIEAHMKMKLRYNELRP